MPELDHLLTLSEVAAAKSVSRTAVLYAVRDGRLPAVRLGRLWLVRRDDLDRYRPRPYRGRRTRRVRLTT